MDKLHEVTRSVLLGLAELTDLLDASPGAVRASLRSTLELQLQGLRTLDAELSAGSLSRRTWSLGRAAVPVLPSLLNGLAKSDADLPIEMVDRCRAAISDLGAELIMFAEGR